MGIVTGLSSVLASGAILIALIGWLCSRADVWSRRAGVLLATVVACYAGGVALILVIGGAAAGESPRLGGVLSVMTLGSIACAAVVTARRR